VFNTLKVPREGLFGALTGILCGGSFAVSRFAEKAERGYIIPFEVERSDEVEGVGLSVLS
jgi:hypothetical protein